DRNLYSASVRCTHAEPAVADLLVVNHRIVDLRGQAQRLRRQGSGRGQDRVGGNHPVTLRGDQRDAGINQVLLRIEHVEGGALPDTGFLAHAVEGDLGRVDLSG